MLLTPEEAAKIIGMSPFTIRRLLRQGELPGRKVGKRQWRIRRADLEQYLGVSTTPNVLSEAQGQSQPKSRRIEELAAEQGVLPVTDLNRLYGGGSPENEDQGETIDAFLAAIREMRESSPAQGKL